MLLQKFATVDQNAVAKAVIDSTKLKELGQIKQHGTHNDAHNVISEKEKYMPSHFKFHLTQRVFKEKKKKPLLEIIFSNVVAAFESADVDNPDISLKTHNDGGID